MSAILEVQDVTKMFNSRMALNGVSLSLESGRVAGLMGPNGAGKTTLMKVIMQITRANSGKALVCGQASVEAIHRMTAFMPDHNHLFEWMRVRDAIHYYADMFADFDIKRADELCGILELSKADRVSSLSKGTTIKVLVMLTFARNARLYLLDEPIGWIDPLGKHNIIKTILSGMNEESSVMIATHQVKDVETILDDVFFLKSGNLVVADSAENVRTEYNRSIEDHYIEVFKHA
ncbi:MAG: ABC transporter ATP-binding protein [Leptolinea sp.]|jgi:ABC-2 type transport system ATP-binding protein|nr:ABC transporter ATP-binding protein [Leptolinea sp.]